LYFLFSLFAPNELAITNYLWLKAHVGIGVRLYHSKHIQQLTTSKRVLYSTFGSVLFNFGSVLFWATAKKLMPQCRTFNIIVGVGSGVALLAIGEMYLRDTDEQVQSEKSEA
jgi:hypothetical protein